MDRYTLKENYPVIEGSCLSVIIFLQGGVVLEGSWQRDIVDLGAIVLGAGCLRDSYIITIIILLALESDTGKLNGVRRLIYDLLYPAATFP